MSLTPRTGDLPRRILAIAPQPFYEDRGTPIAVLQLLKALTERRHAVDLLTFPMGEPVELPGLTVHRVGRGLPVRRVPIGLSVRKLALDALLIPELARRLGERQYDQIHAVEEAAFLALMLGRSCGVPVAYDMQSSLPHQLSQYPLFRSRVADRWFRRCERWLIRHVDAVVCSVGLGDYVRSIDRTVRVQEWWFHSDGALEASPENLRRLRATLGIPDSSLVVLYAGNFEPYQGLSTLLQSVPVVVSRVPATVFVLVGADPKVDRFVERGALRDTGRLKVLPRQPRAAMTEYLALADLLVSPRAFGDNFPLKIFDYMAAGKPIVAIDTPSNRKVLSDEVAILSGGSPAELADAIAGLLQKPEEARRLGAAAKEFAKRNLEWEHYAASVALLVQRAGGRGRAGRRRR